MNPVGGCLPALIQLPIFVGLWQALNTASTCGTPRSSTSRTWPRPTCSSGSPGARLPFLGHYFNLLPFLVVALMLVQTKLFSPPATTPEAEMQQKMMKYMMIFMAFMFYKVPSGLGIYFITSSLWQIGERLLLPKVTAAAHAGRPRRAAEARRRAAAKADPAAATAPRRPQAARPVRPALGEGPRRGHKDPTYRKVMEDRNKGGDDKGRDGDRGRDKGKPRARPGRRR